MSWAAFVQARILGPLGMTQTYTTYASMHAAAWVNQSEPHFRIRDTIRVIADETVDVLPAAGAIWSNATDMGKWLRFMLDSGRVNGTRVVSEANFRMLFAPHSFVSAAEFYPTARVTKPHWMTYGLGWFQQDFRGRFLSFHTGSLAGRTAMVGVLPDARTGIFIAGNLDHAEFRHALLLQAMDIFAGTNGGAKRDWSAEFLTLYKGLHDADVKAVADMEAKRVPGTKPSRPLASYAGTYTHPAWGDMVVTTEGTGLHLAFGPRADNAGTLQHWQYDTFRGELGDGRGGKSTLVFQLDMTGAVHQMLLEGSDAYAFTRVPPRTGTR